MACCNVVLKAPCSCARQQPHLYTTQDERTLLPLREQIRAAAAAAVVSGQAKVGPGGRGGSGRSHGPGLSELSSSSYNRKLGSRNSWSALEGSSLPPNKQSVQRRAAAAAVPSSHEGVYDRDSGASLTDKIEQIRLSMDHILHVSRSPPRTEGIGIQKINSGIAPADRHASRI